MTSIKNLKAARKFGPGYFIREQMEVRGWIQDELAEILDISPKHLNSILQDKQALSIENSQKLASAFETSPQYWLNIDNDYRLWVNERNEDIDAVQSKAMIYSRMPVRDMIKKGWIQDFKDHKELEYQVKDFWGMRSLDFSFLDQALVPLTKKSDAYNQFNASYAATWFQMAKSYSKQFKVSSYDADSLEHLFDDIAAYSYKERGVELFLHHLNNSGVKFFVLPHLDKTYLDGAAFLSGKTPVIVYTARYRRIDNFWFTIAHEIAHILHHLNDKDDFVLDDLTKRDINQQEIEANETAASYLKHDEILDYLSPYIKYLTVPRIQECANDIKVHPSIIIGALSHNNSISYRNLNLFNENVLNCIPGEFIHSSMKI